MIKFLAPSFLTICAATLVSFVTGQWWITVMTTIGAGIWVFSGFARGHGLGLDNLENNIGEESRWLLRPIKRLRNDLGEIAATSKDNPGVSVIAQEAVAEADEIYKRSIVLATAREHIRKSLKGRGEAETNLSKLQRQYAQASGTGESEALESAINARQREIATYDMATSKAQEIESKLKEAEAALSELKSRLAVGALSSGTLDTGQDELNDMIQRLKVLGSSFEEAQAELEVRPS